MKVLIVDDIAFNRRLISMVLEQHGYQVLVASGGGEALELLQDNNDVQAVICDLVMPEMDGIETLKQSQSLKRFNDNGFVPLPPFFMLTEITCEKSKRDALIAGYSEVLYKPIDKPLVLKLLQQVEEGSYVSSNEPLKALVFYGQNQCLDTLVAYLEEKNYQVFTSNAPAEAFGFLTASKKIDLIVTLDPALETFEKLADSFKAYFRNNQLEVVPILGFTSQYNLLESFRASCNIVIELPFDHYQVDSALRALFQTEADACEDVVEAKVMYIDEVTFSRNVMGKNFRQHYIASILASSAEEAVHLYQADTSIRVILCKSDMAETNAEKLFQEVKQISRYRDDELVPPADFVVLVDERDKIRGKSLEKLGISKTTPRNYKANELMDTLHEILSHGPVG